MISFFSAFTTPAVFLCDIRLILIKFYSTLKKQLQLNLHGMKSCFHHHKLPLGHRLKLFGGHERTLDHLQRLRGSVFTSRNRACHYRSAAKSFGERLGRGTVRSKTAEQCELRIVYDNFRTFFAVVLLKLREGLNNRDDLQASAS